MRVIVWLRRRLRSSSDLALQATKHTARAVGHYDGLSSHRMPPMTESHWDSREGKSILLDAPISQTGLFGKAVSSVVDTFRSAKSQSAAHRQFMPRRTRDPSNTPSSYLSRERSLPRKEPPIRAHSPPTTVWGARGRPLPHRWPRRRVDLEQPDRPSTSASSSRSWPSGWDEKSFQGFLSRQGQTVQTFLPPLTHSPLLYLPSGFQCAEKDSVYIRVAVERRIRLSPSSICSSITRGPPDRRCIWFSPTADGPHTGHSSAHEQGRQQLSFVVDDVAPLGPFRYPNTGMSSRPQHYTPSIAFLSWMGASTRGIVLGSPHSSVRLHTSVWQQSPPSKGFIRL